MSYNMRRNTQGVNAGGPRRNTPLTANFILGGQLPPQNRPLQPRGPGPQNPPNFRPQNPGQQRPPGILQQRLPPTHVPPIQTQPEQPPQQLQQQSSLPDDKGAVIKNEELKNTVEKRNTFFNIKGQKISKKERQRRRNFRLGKILQPKNAVMILNELVKSVTYTVTDNLQPLDSNQYTATVLVDGVSHIGHGRSKMDAKSMAAENALRYIIKNKQFSAFSQTDEDGDEKMLMGDDETSPSLPWQHFASFALYKLLQSWGEDPTQSRGEGTSATQSQNRPAKKMPDNAAHINPLMLLNQMLPQVQFEELTRTGSPPNVIFNFKCSFEKQTFSGTGPNKKSAKKMAAFAICHNVLGVQYPPEVYTPTN